MKSWTIGSRERGVALPVLAGMAVALLVADATAAKAHEPVAGVSGFASLVLHPIAAVDTVLVIVALGIVAGATERPKLVALGAPLLLAGATVGVFLQSQAIVVPGLWRLPLLVSMALGGLAAAMAQGGRATYLIALGLASVTIGLSLPPDSATIQGRLEAGLAATMALLLGEVVVGMPRALAGHAAARLAGRIAGAWIVAIAALGLAAGLR